MVSMNHFCHHIDVTTVLKMSGAVTVDLIYAFVGLLVCSLYDSALNSLWTGTRLTSSCRWTAMWGRWSGLHRAPPPASGCWSHSAPSAWSFSAATETTPTNPPSATCLHGYTLVNKSMESKQTYKTQTGQGCMGGGHQLNDAALLLFYQFVSDSLCKA